MVLGEALSARLRRFKLSPGVAATTDGIPKSGKETLGTGPRCRSYLIANEPAWKQFPPHCAALGERYRIEIGARLRAKGILRRS